MSSVAVKMVLSTCGQQQQVSELEAVITELKSGTSSMNDGW